MAWARLACGLTPTVANIFVERAVRQNGGTGAVITVQGGRSYVARGYASRDEAIAATAKRDSAPLLAADFTRGGNSWTPVLARIAVCAGGFCTAMFAAIDLCAGTNIVSSHVSAAATVAALGGTSFACGVLSFADARSAEANLMSISVDKPVLIGRG
jgi:hypothetical protein